MATPHDKDKKQPNPSSLLSSICLSFLISTLTLSIYSSALSLKVSSVSFTYTLPLSPPAPRKKKKDVSHGPLLG